jgi:glycogen operon protein
MNDLVSYREKHNLANGEDNRDGDNNNHSENFGVEGPTNQPIIDALRLRQIKNMLSTLMLSQGVPMLVAGDEFRRTQKGNNNAYCQDNEISWIDWSLQQKNTELTRFVRALIQFRKNQPTVRRCTFLTGVPNSKDGWADVSWYNALGTAVDWHSSELPIICLLAAPTKEEDPSQVGRDVLLMLNSSSAGCRFMIPAIARSRKWRMFMDTSLVSPKDIYPDLDGPKLPENGSYTLPQKSMAVYVAD